jgi:phenylalanyl-tRNA synthetase beta chain
MVADLAQRTAGCEIPVSECIDALARVGCEVSQDADVLNVLPPSWRPDLTDPADCVEEVLRLHGFDQIPARLPMAPPGYGRTPIQRLRRVVGMTMAAMGCVEVLNYPFVSVTDLDALRFPSDDPRRRTPMLANPLSAEAPFMRSMLLPGVLAAARRNRGRGLEDIAIWELGRVFVLKAGQSAEGSADPIRPSVAHRPSDKDFAALEALLPDQPQHLAAVWCGQIEPSGWWGAGRNAEWSDAVDAALRVISAAGAEATVVCAVDSPFHPGRTAQLVISGTVIGHAGELHPATCAHFGLTPRSVAFEIDLDALAAFASLPAAPVFSIAPVAKEDLALVVPAHVAAGDVAATLQAAGDDLVEDVRLFDVYEGPQVPAGHRSLAFALRLRAPGRTLTPEEISGVRSAAIEAAAAAHGATLR